MRKHGLTVDNLLAADVVNADGELLRASEDQHRDIAWTRRFIAALGRFREGVYVNFLGSDEDPDRVREA